MFFRSLVLFSFLSGSPTLAHELWIEPEKFQVETGAPLHAHIRNGENFVGNSLAFFPSRNIRLEIVMRQEITPVVGRLGDSPAVQMTAPDREGLLIIAHEAAPSTVTYTEWDKFLAFAAHKDFTQAGSDHIAAGWPQDQFRERYTRHSKALVAVGHGEGEDRNLGLRTEFIARTNPYDRDFDGRMVVDLIYGGVARGNAQVEVFDRAPDLTVTLALHRTDDNGRAIIPVTSGHEYLFDAVVLRPAPDAGATERSPVWETLWASLSFAVPE